MRLHRFSLFVGTWIQLCAQMLVAVVVLELCAPFLERAYATPATDSLVGYWKLDETVFNSCSGGQDSCDSSGDGYHGTESGTPTISTDVPSAISFPNARSLSFDGINDYVDVGNDMYDSHTRGTITAWVKPTNFNAKMTLFSSASDSDNLEFSDFSILDTTGKLSFQNRTDQNFVESSTALTAGVWQHVAVTSNGSSWQFYINGSPVTTTATVGSNTGDWFSASDAGINSYAIGLLLRQSGPIQPWLGLIDDVRVYKRALSPWEISELYAGRHIPIYWKGTTNTSYEGPGNWSGSYLPDPYSRVVVRASVNQPVMTGAVRVAGLTINTGATLNLNGTGLTMNDSGVFTNYGTLLLRNTETISNVTIPTTKGTVMIAGTGSQTGFQTGNSYHNLTLNDGLVGYWKLDETSGTRAADASGYTNSGVLVGGPTISTTVAPTNFHNKRSLSFDGTDDYIDIGSGSALNMVNGLTMALWMRSSSTDGGLLLGKYDNTFGGSPYLLYRSSSESVVRFYTQDAATNADNLQGTVNVSNGVWHHIAATFDGTKKRLYVDGIQDVTSSETLLDTAPTALRMGRDAVNALGTITADFDDVRLYNRPLSASEVAALAAGNHPATASGTITMNSALAVAGNLTLNGRKLDVSSSNYAVSVSGSWLNDGGSFTARNSTVTLEGNTAGMEILSGGQRFGNLTIGGGSSGVWNTRDRLTVSGALTISSSTLDASGSYVIHAGSWTQNGGTFTPRSGTVVLDKTSSATLTPSSAFNTLRLEDPSEAGLVGYWKMDEGQGGTVRDFSGYGNNGTTVNGPTWSGGTLYTPSAIQFDNPFAMKFDGSDDYVVTTAGPGLTTAATYSIWVKTSSTEAQAINYPLACGLYLWVGGTYSDAVVAAKSIGLYTGAAQAASAVANSFTTTDYGSWHHIVAVYDSTASQKTRIWKNGVELSMFSNGISGFIPSPSEVTIGRRSDGLWYFNGLLDDVRIYNRALSANEIVNLYRGRYALGGSGTATVTLGGALSASTLALDSGNLATSSYGATVTNAFTLARGNGNLTLGSATTRLNGGLTLSGSTVTGGAGTLAVTGNVSLLTGSLIAPSGLLTLSGNWSKMGGSFQHNGGTVTMSGSSAQTLRSGSGTFKHLTVNKSSGTVQLVGSEADIDGNLTLTSGIFSASGFTVNLSGSLIRRTAGFFRSTTGSLVLDGRDQTLSGTLAVYHLRKIVSAASTLTFDTGDTYTATGSLVLRGAAGNLLSVRSSVTGTAVALKLASGGSQTIDYVDVKDSNASGGEELVCVIASEGCLDSTNNTNWRFTASSSGGGSSSGDSGGGNG